MIFTLLLDFEVVDNNNEANKEFKRTNEVNLGFICLCLLITNIEIVNYV